MVVKLEENTIWAQLRPQDRDQILGQVAFCPTWYKYKLRKLTKTIFLITDNMKILLLIFEVQCSAANPTTMQYVSGLMLYQLKFNTLYG